MKFFRKKLSFCQLCDNYVSLWGKHHCILDNILDLHFSVGDQVVIIQLKNENNIGMLRSDVIKFVRSNKLKALLELIENDLIKVEKPNWTIGKVNEKCPYYLEYMLNSKENIKNIKKV